MTEKAKELVTAVVNGASILKVSRFIYKTVTTMTPDISGFLDLFTDESKKLAKTMEEFERRFQELAESAGIERIVVFIDDLDRCSGSKVIDTFETIKLFLDTPACTFVIGVDAKRIEAAVGEAFSLPMNDERTRRDYLEKIIQVPFNIPQQSLEDICAYVAMLLVSRTSSSDIRDSIAQERASLLQAENMLVHCEKWLDMNKALFGTEHDAVLCDLRSTLPYVPILARGLRGNPRQIKRFLNILAIRRRLAASNNLDIKQEFLIKLTTLEYVWESIFRAVSDTVDPRTGSSDLVAGLLDETLHAELVDQSPLFVEVLQSADAIQFLLDDPKLTPETDLRPYMFLAQTSLSRQPVGELVPTSAEIQSLVGGIENEDRLLSKAAARRTAASDAGMAEAVISQLGQRFGTVKSEVARTHVIMGLGIVAERHVALHKVVVAFLSSADNVPTAANLFIPDILTKAKAAGVTVGAELEGKYASNLGKVIGRAGKKR